MLPVPEGFRVERWDRCPGGLRGRVRGFRSRRPSWPARRDEDRRSCEGIPSRRERSPAASSLGLGIGTALAVLSVSLTPAISSDPDPRAQALGAAGAVGAEINSSEHPHDTSKPNPLNRANPECKTKPLGAAGSGQGRTGQRGREPQSQAPNPAGWNHTIPMTTSQAGSPTQAGKPVADPIESRRTP